MTSKKIPGKVILFGEHIILVGGRALAIPMPQLSGHWTFKKKEGTRTYQKELMAFGNYLKKLGDDISFKIEVDKYLTDIKNGMYFYSNIPVGYGVGSSGAIVAAVCERYSDLDLNGELNLLQLKKELGLMENHFHGASSGIDPLISLLNQPLLIESDGSISTTAIPPSNKTGNNNLTLFLLDTKIPRKTGPLVKLFKESMKSQEYADHINNQFIPTSNLAIDQLLNNDVVGLRDSFERISRLQFELFWDMIPEGFVEKWQKGLDSGLYCLKICGAGGGGFLLGVTGDLDGARDAFGGCELVVLWRFLPHSSQ